MYPQTWFQHKKTKMQENSTGIPFSWVFGVFHWCIVGFLRGGVQGGGNWGTLRIPREDGGTLGNH